jgi:hypothetical protein
LFMAFHYGWEGGEGSLSTLIPCTVTKRIERFIFFVLWRFNTDEKVGRGRFRLWIPTRSQSESKGSLFLFSGVTLRMGRFGRGRFRLWIPTRSQSESKDSLFLFFGVSLRMKRFGRGHFRLWIPTRSQSESKGSLFFVFGRFTTDEKVRQETLSTLNAYTVTKRMGFIV